jgi:hypothetical protein
VWSGEGARDPGRKGGPGNESGERIWRSESIIVFLHQYIRLVFSSNTEEFGRKTGSARLTIACVIERRVEVTNQVPGELQLFQAEV